MKLLKIGTRIIDADKIIGVEIDGDHLVVAYSAAADSALLARLADFQGPDAAALRGWIERNADDITGREEPSGPEAGAIFDTSALFERADDN